MLDADEALAGVEGAGPGVRFLHLQRQGAVEGRGHMIQQGRSDADASRIDV